MTTPKLGLAELVASQSQPHLTVNSALRRAEGSIQLSVLDRALNTPPGSPAEGDTYIVGAAPTGAWSTYAEGDIAFYTGGAWLRIQPLTGWLAYVQDEAAFYYRDEAASPPAWTILSTGGSSPTTTAGDLIVRGAAVDERLAVGSEGQVLKVVSGAPAWGAAGGGGLEDYQRVVYVVLGTEFEPPPTPTTGDVYYMDGTLGGAWSGFDVGNLARYNGATWDEIVPELGSLMWNIDVGWPLMVVENSGTPRSWVPVVGPPAPDPIYAQSFYAGVVPDGEVLMRFQVPIDCSIAADWGGAAKIKDGSSPSDDWTAEIYRNATLIGTFTVFSAGGYSVETDANAANYADGNDIIYVIAPTVSPETGPEDLWISLPLLPSF